MTLNYDSAVVITPGRTGSQMIMKNFSNFSKIKITHTHNPLWKPQNNSIAFVSRRRNVFNSISSTLVGTRSNEFTQYTNKIIEPFTVDRLEFENCFWFYSCYYNAIDRSQYAKVVDVWYEDLISDPKYLFGLIGVDRTTDLTFPKSPYNYYQLITNIDQCQEWYDQLSKLPVTQNLIDSIKSSIKSDLDKLQ